MNRSSRQTIGIFAGLLLFSRLITSSAAQDGAPLPWIAVSPDKSRFIQQETNQPFVPWGFNYDHDSQGRLIEDYWHTDWPLVEKHFGQMRVLGANVVRVHLQFGKFLTAPNEVDPRALEQFDRLVRLAEQQRLYLDLTGLGCYHKKGVPAWYDELSEPQRWEAQACFWRAIAQRCRNSPAIFCYDLMNEPVVPGGRRADKEWLGPPFGDKHFVQFITLDQRERPRPAIARAWVEHLTRAIREHDKRHLITVGLVDWSLDRPGLTSGFVPSEIAGSLDFLAVHLYPQTGKRDEALATLRGFQIGKPVIVEETFPLSCSPEELAQFIDAAGPLSAGWIGFYWGRPPDELRAEKTIAAALTLGWLELFEKRAPRR